MDRRNQGTWIKNMHILKNDKHYVKSKTPGPRFNYKEVIASEDPKRMRKSLRLQHSNKISDKELFFEQSPAWS
ncbi:hypothetical protein M0802_016933 [Mischocyttarus mexicanus]|nr:hypothetical protein M0802_016933 [Mischocyttarus mexicanus]